MKKHKTWIIAGLAFLLGLAVNYFINPFAPKSYEDCAIKYVSSAASSAAATILDNACYDKFSVESELTFDEFKDAINPFED